MVFCGNHVLHITSLSKELTLTVQKVENVQHDQAREQEQVDLPGDLLVDGVELVDIEADKGGRHLDLEVAVDAIVLAERGVGGVRGFLLKVSHGGRCV